MVFDHSPDLLFGEGGVKLCEILSQQPKTIQVSGISTLWVLPKQVIKEAIHGVSLIAMICDQDAIHFELRDVVSVILW